MHKKNAFLIDKCEKIDDEIKDQNQPNKLTESELSLPQIWSQKFLKSALCSEECPAKITRRDGKNQKPTSEDQHNITLAHVTYPYIEYNTHTHTTCMYSAYLVGGFEVSSSNFL